MATPWTSTPVSQLLSNSPSRPTQALTPPPRTPAPRTLPSVRKRTHGSTSSSRTNSSPPIPCTCTATISLCSAKAKARSPLAWPAHSTSTAQHVVILPCWLAKAILSLASRPTTQVHGSCTVTSRGTRRVVSLCSSWSAQLTSQPPLTLCPTRSNTSATITSPTLNLHPTIFWAVTRVSRSAMSSWLVTRKTSSDDQRRRQRDI